MRSRVDPILGLDRFQQARVLLIRLARSTWEFALGSRHAGAENLAIESREASPGDRGGVPPALALVRPGLSRVALSGQLRSCRSRSGLQVGPTHHRACLAPPGTEAGLGVEPPRGLASRLLVRQRGPRLPGGGGRLLRPLPQRHGSARSSRSLATHRCFSTMSIPASHPLQVGVGPNRPGLRALPDGRPRARPPAGPGFIRNRLWACSSLRNPAASRANQRISSMARGERADPLARTVSRLGRPRLPLSGPDHGTATA